MQELKIKRERRSGEQRANPRRLRGGERFLRRRVRGMSSTCLSFGGEPWQGGGCSLHDGEHQEFPAAEEHTNEQSARESGEERGAGGSGAGSGQGAAGAGLGGGGEGGDGGGGGGSICVPGVGLGFFFFSVGCWEADGALRSGPAALPSPPLPVRLRDILGLFTSFLPSFPSGSLARCRGTRGRQRRGVRTGPHPTSHLSHPICRIPHPPSRTPEPASLIPWGRMWGSGTRSGGSKSDRHTCKQFAKEPFVALPPLPLGSGSPRPGEARRPGAG